MTKTHKVYVLKRADGLAKIGTTTDLPGRMRSLSQSHGPLEVVRVLDGDAKLERKLHHKFRRWHQFGEWFKSDAEMLAEIAALVNGEELLATTSDIRADWERGEAEMASQASDKVLDLIAHRRARKDLTRPQAIAELSADYNLPIAFLMHLQKRKASTVSAHGFAALRDALRQEMLVLIEDLEGRMAAIRAGEQVK